jgi:hypothetical protein
MAPNHATKTSLLELFKNIPWKKSVSGTETQELCGLKTALKESASALPQHLGLADRNLHDVQGSSGCRAALVGRQQTLLVFSTSSNSPKIAAR